MKIEIRNISKTLKKNKVLSNVSLSLEGGKIYGLFGYNGSGKTMLLRCICGLLKVDEGEIVVDGQVLSKEIDFPQSIGAIIETPGFFKYYTGYENLEMLAKIKGVIGKEEILDVLETVGLSNAKDQTVGKYSLGMRQRLAIAQAIMEAPELLVLDEPTNALDEEGINMFRELLKKEKEKGTLIIIASHNKDDINQLSDVKLKMDHGMLSVVEEKEI